MKFYFVIIFVFLLTSAEGQDKPEFETGKCYAKCFMPYTYEDEFNWYNIYTGDNPDTFFVEEIEIVVKPEREIWVRKKNKKSRNPLKALLLCLVLKEEETETRFIVKDISITEEYIEEEIGSRILLEEGREWEWKEVLCRSEFTDEFWNYLRNELRERGFFTSEDMILENALMDYQRDNNLPIGNFDFETLYSLGLDYYTD